MSKWKFSRVIPCHLANDIRAGPAAFSAAFNFLRAPDAAPTAAPALPSLPSLPSLPLLPALEKLLSAWRAAVPSLVPSAGSAGRRGPRALPDDLRLLSAASDLCTKAGLVAPVPSGRAD